MPPQVSHICILNTHLEYSQLVHCKNSPFRTVLLQVLLNTAYPAIEHIYIFHVLHGLGYDGIAISIDIRKIFRTGISIQTPGIHQFNMILKLIKPDRCIRLVITMHTGIHKQLSQNRLRIICYRLFTKQRYRHRPLSHYRITDK